jgi:hypothetical protein
VSDGLRDPSLTLRALIEPLGGQESKFRTKIAGGQGLLDKSQSPKDLI